MKTLVWYEVVDHGVDGMAPGIVKGSFFNSQDADSLKAFDYSWHVRVKSVDVYDSFEEFRSHDPKRLAEKARDSLKYVGFTEAQLKILGL